MNVIILAAGFGTRLFPLTESIPKALIKINNKPIIEHILKQIEAIKEVNHIYLLSNNKFYINFLEWLSEFRKESKIAEKIKIVNNGINKEDKKKGAIADFKFVSSFAGEDDLLLIAGDNIFNADLNDIINLSIEKDSSSMALKIVKDKESIKKYSCAILDENKKIISFEEKPLNPKSEICGTACYFLKKGDVAKIIKHNFQGQDNIGGIIEFLVKNSRIYGRIYDKKWFDIGNKEAMEKAENYFQGECPN